MLVVAAFLFVFLNVTMAGTITALKIQKRDKERVNVFIDDEFAFGVTLTVAMGLRQGQALSDVEIETLKQGDERDKAYHRAVRLLGRRPRSQAETTRYLRDKGYPDEVIVDTLNRLVEQQYLDDKAFVQFWVENRERFKPRGERALRYELRQKGIADDLIEAALGDVDEAVSAWAAVEPKLNRWRNLAAADLKKKVVGFLNRRGFGYEIANQTFRRVCDELGTPDEETGWF